MLTKTKEERRSTRSTVSNQARIYDKIENKRRMALVKMVSKNIPLGEACYLLNINYSTGRNILKTYKTEGRIKRKTTWNGKFQVVSSTQPHSPKSPKSPQSAPPTNSLCNVIQIHQYHLCPQPSVQTTTSKSSSDSSFSLPSLIGKRKYPVDSDFFDFSYYTCKISDHIFKRLSNCQQ